jgi:hypothetical protein
VKQPNKEAMDKEREEIDQKLKQLEKSERLQQAEFSRIEVLVPLCHH